MDVPVDANVEDKERDFSPSASLFRILNVAAGQRLDRQAIDKSYIVFYLSGHNMSVCNNSRAKRLSEGMAFLIPKHACVYGMSLTDSEYLLCEIPDEFEERDRLYLQSLSEELPEDFEYDFNTVQIVPIVQKYILGMKYAIETGFTSEYYQQMKRRELFYYFRECYDPKEMAAFMYPLIGGKSISFKNFVIDNYSRYKDVKSFAEAACMSESTFSRKFKESFGTTVYRWMTRRKAEYIYKDILLTEMTFSEIADKYGFSSPSYFVSYCRQHFGMPPNEIRKNRGGYRILHNLTIFHKFLPVYRKSHLAA